MFVLQNAADPTLKLPGLTIEFVGRRRAQRKFDLTLMLAGGTGGYRGIASSTTRIFSTQPRSSG